MGVRMSFVNDGVLASRQDLHPLWSMVSGWFDVLFALKSVEQNLSVLSCCVCMCVPSGYLFSVLLCSVFSL